MSELNGPFEIFRVSVPDGEYSRRADVVEKLHYDAAQDELVLRRKERDQLCDALKSAEKQRDELFDLISRICAAGAEIVSGKPEGSGDIQ